MLHPIAEITFITVAAGKNTESKPIELPVAKCPIALSTVG